jgi:hypothetical protein
VSLGDVGRNCSVGPVGNWVVGMEKSRRKKRQAVYVESYLAEEKARAADNWEAMDGSASNDKESLTI